MPPEAELDGTWCRRVKPLRVQSRRRRSCSDIPSPVVDNLDRRKGRPIVDRRGSEPTHDESKLVALDAHDAKPTTEIVTHDRQHALQIRPHRRVGREVGRKVSCCHTRTLNPAGQASLINTGAGGAPSP